MNYQAYLSTPEWQVLRRLKLIEAGGRCQVCNNNGEMHVHHRTYARLGKELLSDLTVLCSECHNIFHDKQPF